MVLVETVFKMLDFELLLSWQSMVLSSYPVLSHGSQSTVQPRERTIHPGVLSFQARESSRSV